MNRDDAKRTIAANEVKKLSDSDKLKILENNYWCFEDKEDITESIEKRSFPRVSESFIELICKTTNPILTEESEILLIDNEINSLEFVSNSYLEAKLRIINPNSNNIVSGEEEKAGLCPCCEHYSIDYGEDGLWDICPVCFWENGGDGPNHMSLEEAKLNFIKLGAMSERSLEFIDKEGKLKYKKYTE
ncbi:MAG: CPCC family cysteine-rich protein [Flavobacterium sp.]